MNRIEKKPISWLYERVEGLETLFKEFPFSTIFLKKERYIAGGFLRQIIRDGTTEHLPGYFDEGGDIDIFTESEQDSVKAMISLRGRWNESRGMNAKETTLRFSEGCIDAKVQVITSHFAPPEEMLQRFDFVNSQIATDGEFVWVNPELLGLEARRELMSAGLTQHLPSRVIKYFKRHEYDRLTDDTKNNLIKWFMLDKHKHRFANDVQLHADVAYGDVHASASLCLFDLLKMGILNYRDVKQLKSKYASYFQLQCEPFYIGADLDPVSAYELLDSLKDISVGDLLELDKMKLPQRTTHTVVVVSKNEKTLQVIDADNAISSITLFAIKNVITRFNETIT